ncbi:hypothetical protein VISP3789_10239 [Vibrio splendidus ATCC 33789]|nr:hypothetical protein VISP3789_10239 [Vibrio splendidus ATCC 33789]
MNTNINTLVAIGASRWIPYHFAANSTQSTTWTATNAISTMITVIDGMRVMTGYTVEIASL